MKTTRYFDHVRIRTDRKSITDNWILGVVKNPVKTEIQSDGRIKKWGKITELDDRYLRVILLEDGETVHNAFFDRGFKR